MALARGPWTLVCAFALLGAAFSVSAQTAPTPQVLPVVVVGATPVPGVNVPIAKAPYAVETLTAGGLGVGAVPTAVNGLLARVGDVSINDVLDDPFQPDLLYRGFEASPVLGTPAGLAVYQNGVRINDAFGDTVEWDLVPADAISQITVVGTNPVYGLNALGGAVVIAMKNGFDNPGAEVDASGGWFGRRSASITLGSHSDTLAEFITARVFDEDGWRELSSDSVRQVYAVLSARKDGLTLDLSYTGADNLLHGQGAAPVQELAVNRSLIFTSPQANANQLNFVTLNGTWQASSAWSFQADIYLRDLRQAVANGNTTRYTACAVPGEVGFLCQPDAATPLTSTLGGPIPDISQGGAIPIGENDGESLHAVTFGGAAQATSTAKVLGHGNLFSVGVAADSARTDFGSFAQLGVINAQLVVQPSPYIVDTPEGSPFTVTPVAVRADDTDFGAFATDTFDITRRLSLTASARYNWIRDSVHDRLGTSLDSVNTYARFNPAIGATYQVSPDLSAYAGYAEGSRAPTASEIDCSDPAAPCLLPSSLSADPPLKQVVSHTFEIGVRGAQRLGRGLLSYSAGLYDTKVSNDIYAVATSLSAGFFQNIPGTLRRGGELNINYQDDRLTLYLSYAHVEATFDASLVIPSPSNPFQNAEGNIFVHPGDRLPGVPADRLKLGADYLLLRGFHLGGDLQVMSGQYYGGDEANQLAPIPGYAVLGLHANYQVTPRLLVFARIENALNARYASYGVLGDPTGVGAPGIPPDGVTNGPGVDNRFQSPGQPFGVYGGAELRF